MSTAQLTEKNKTQGFSEAKTSEESRRKAAKFRTPHNGKAEGAQKDNPIPAIGPFLGLLEIGLERAGCGCRLCPPRVLSGNSQHNSPCTGEERTSTTGNRRRASSGTTHARMQEGGDVQGGTGKNRRVPEQGRSLTSGP